MGFRFQSLPLRYNNMAQTKAKSVIPQVTQGFDIKQLIVNQHRIVRHIQRGGTLKNFKI